MYPLLEGLEIVFLNFLKRNLAMFSIFHSILVSLKIYSTETFKNWTEIYTKKKNNNLGNSFIYISEKLKAI